MMIRFRRFRGFTLIEVIVVIALIGVLAAVAIPYFMKLGRRQKLMAEAQQIQSDLIAARMRAIKRNTVAIVMVTPAAGATNYHVFRTFEPTPPPLPGPGTPTPVQYNLSRNVPATSFNVTPPAGSAITFRGDGSAAAPGAFVIEGPPSATTPNRVTIQTDPIGRVHMITPTSWQ